jgi:DNA-directed RNA polymerase specialized sigma24 family protein
MNYEIDIPSLENIENDIFNKLEAEEIWNYLKKKRVEVVKVFYLYFYLDFKISEIAHILNMSDSKVKNILYRNIKEMKERINKDV